MGTRARKAMEQRPSSGTQALHASSESNFTNKIKHFFNTRFETRGNSFTTNGPIRDNDSVSACPESARVGLFHPGTVKRPY